MAEDTGVCPQYFVSEDTPEAREEKRLAHHVDGSQSPRDALAKDEIRLYLRALPATRDGPVQVSVNGSRVCDSGQMDGRQSRMITAKTGSQTNDPIRVAVKIGCMGFEDELTAYPLEGRHLCIYCSDNHIQVYQGHVQFRPQETAFKGIKRLTSPALVACFERAQKEKEERERELKSKPAPAPAPAPTHVAAPAPAPTPTPMKLVVTPIQPQLPPQTVEETLDKETARLTRGLRMKFGSGE